MNKKVKRTVLILGAIAVSLYLGFIYMAATGSLQPPVQG